MTRLIEAEALKAQIQREIDMYYDEDGGGIHTAMEARDEIDYAPTVDAIPISFIKSLIDLSRKVGADHHAESLEILLADWAERKQG